MEHEVVLLRDHRAIKGRTSRFAKRQSANRPQALFVEPVIGLMRRGEVVVQVRGQVLRAALALASGAIVNSDEMEEWEFFGRRDGGPYFARQSMQFALREARVALSSLGYLTSNQWFQGSRAKPMPMPMPEMATAP